MLLGNASLLAILHQGAEPEPQYLNLLLVKVALDGFLLVFVRSGLVRSFMGVCFLSLCLADVLLAAMLGIAPLIDGRHGNPAPQAFLLSHASAVYAFLPMPTLALGALDLAWTAHKHSGVHTGTGRRLGWVLALWTSAVFYSAWDTDPSVQEVVWGTDTGPGSLAQVCEVQASRQVSVFCLALLGGMALALLPHLLDIPRLSGQINRLTAQREVSTETPHILALPVPIPIFLSPRAFPPPLHLSCMLLLAMHWCPYLLVHLSCELLQLAVPSYASVNTLWLSCANSLLVGIAYWGRGGYQNGHHDWYHDSHHDGHHDWYEGQDAICDWRIASYLSYRVNPDPPQLPLELQTPTDRKLKPLFLL